jgi:hypothetical protein
MTRMLQNSAPVIRAICVIGGQFLFGCGSAALRNPR